MSKTKQRLWLICMLLIYVAIAIAGFVVVYEIKHNFSSHEEPIIPTPQVSRVTPIQTPVGWKTYTNQEAKLKLAYPPTDHVKTSSYGFGVTSVTLQDKEGNADFQILLLPKSLAQAVGQNFDNYYAMPDNTTKVIKSPLAQDNTTEKFTKVRNREVHGLQALDYKSLASKAPKGSQPEIGTFILAGNTLALVSTGQDNKMKLEQLLSSFTYNQ